MNALTPQAVPPGIPAVLNSGRKHADTGAGLALIVAAGFGKDAQRVFFLLREALYRGEFPRGEAGRIVGSSERTGRALLTKATEAGLLKSDTPKSAVRLAVPLKVLGTYFPELFPAGQVGAVYE